MKVKKDKKSIRDKALRKIRMDMQKDKTDPSRVSKWLKLMESKKRVFALEDEIDKITQRLKSTHK